jgi:hypothetical protein
MPRPNLVIITEGQTETRALPELLGMHLRGFGLEPIFSTIDQSGPAKGEIESFTIPLDNIRKAALQIRGCHISTFFDYYGLNSSWPGVSFCHI